MRVAKKNPSHVRPEPADARCMWILRLVRVLMMQPMRGDPEDRPTFESQCAADGQEILKRLVGLEAAMGVQPMVPHADAPATGDPVEHDGRDQIGPGESEKCRNGLDMEPDENETRQDVQLAVPGLGLGGDRCDYVGHARSSWRMFYLTYRSARDSTVRLP